MAWFSTECDISIWWQSDEWRVRKQGHEQMFASSSDLYSTVEVKSLNRRERKYTYDVIGIMKGEIEPGILS